MHTRAAAAVRRHATLKLKGGPHSPGQVLQERDPSLIDLPIPIPSIPILEPLISPLIGGEPWPAPTSSEPAQTATATVTATVAVSTTTEAEQEPTQETSRAPATSVSTTVEPASTQAQTQTESTETTHAAPTSPAEASPPPSASASPPPPPSPSPSQASPTAAPVETSLVPISLPPSPSPSPSHTQALPTAAPVETSLTPISLPPPPNSPRPTDSVSSPAEPTPAGSSDAHPGSSPNGLSSGSATGSSAGTRGTASSAGDDNSGNAAPGDPGSSVASGRPAASTGGGGGRSGAGDGGGGVGGSESLTGSPSLRPSQTGTGRAQTGSVTPSARPATSPSGTQPVGATRGTAASGAALQPSGADAATDEAQTATRGDAYGGGAVATSAPHAVESVDGGRGVSDVSGSDVGGSALAVLATTASGTGTLFHYVGTSASTHAVLPVGTGTRLPSLSSPQQSQPGTGPPPSSRPTSQRDAHALSKGAIAAMTVLLGLGLLLGLLLGLRRRSKARRAARRRRWLFRGRTADVHAPVSSAWFFARAHDRHPSFGAGAGDDTLSEHVTVCAGELASVSPTPPPPTSPIPTPPIPTLPPMPTSPPPPPSRRPPALDLREPHTHAARVWPSELHGLDFPPPPRAPTVASVPRPTVRSPDRERASAGADSDVLGAWGQWAWDAQEAREEGAARSSMCVRPFSASEAWQFPRPPSHAHVHGEAEREAERDLINLRTPTLGSEESAGAGSSAEYVTAPETSTPPSDGTSGSGGHTPPSTQSACTAPSRPGTAQYAPSLASADGSIGAHFAHVETIRRPFAPALPDEMAVAPGERVRMLRRFDDGWAEAVKLGADPAAGAVARGLIPIDCLRMPGEELPAFLAAKRLSSYRGARSPSPGLREWEGEEMGMWEAV